MKPFDLKAAQAGEPILINVGSPFRQPDNGLSEWEQHRFVGLKANGDVVSESDSRAVSLWSRPQEHVRMAPKKLTLNIEITFHNGVIHSHWVTQKQTKQQSDGPEWQYRYATIEVDAP